MTIGRRDVLKLAAGAALAAPNIARAQSARVLRFVPQANLANLDPVFTTEGGTKDYAFLTALAFARSFARPAQFRKLTVIGYIVAAFAGQTAIVTATRCNGIHRVQLASRLASHGFRRSIQQRETLLINVGPRTRCFRSIGG